MLSIKPNGMKNLPLFLIINLLVTSNLHCQTVDQIKADRHTYIWGQGTGTTLNRADQEAMQQIVTQISAQVESSFTLLKDEMSQNGNSENYMETFHSVINTYSSATLKNTERIVLGNEPDANVFRYIKRDEIEKVFRERKEKIIAFAGNAEKAMANNQIADGLRYYYWTLTLLMSHPDGSSIDFMDKDGKTQRLAIWLPIQINNAFTGTTIRIVHRENETETGVYTLSIMYQGQLAENFDYAYWDGTDWSNLISSRNGIGLVELYGVAKQTNELKIKAEYIFEGEARIDRELEDVLKKIEPIPFRKSYYTIPISGIVSPADSIPDITHRTLKADIKEAPLTEAADVVPYQQSIETILNAVNTKNYEAVKDEFTEEGFDIFNKLINYGNAKVIGAPEMKFIVFEDKIIGRSIPMSFDFKTNNKQFIENVVFHFNKKGKVESLAFGLSQTALDNIVKNDTWKEHERLILVNFLEQYKTAYALKRIDFIEQIFSDDALIITGTVVKVKPNETNRFKGNQIVEYNRQDKQTYIKNLRYSFSSKEYINLKFEESKISKAGKGGDIYGVQIKQNYFSANYGDVGYLFLMVDLNNPEEPIIHIRTWQPEIGANDSIYGLSDFN